MDNAKYWSTLQSSFAKCFRITAKTKLPLFDNDVIEKDETFMFHFNRIFYSLATNVESIIDFMALVERDLGLLVDKPFEVKISELMGQDLSGNKSSYFYVYSVILRCYYAVIHTGFESKFKRMMEATNAAYIFRNWCNNLTDGLFESGALTSNTVIGPWLHRIYSLIFPNGKCVISTITSKERNYAECFRNYEFRFVSWFDLNYIKPCPVPREVIAAHERFQSVREKRKEATRLKFGTGNRYSSPVEDTVLTFRPHLPPTPPSSRKCLKRCNALTAEEWEEESNRFSKVQAIPIDLTCDDSPASLYFDVSIPPDSPDSIEEEELSDFEDEMISIDSIVKCYPHGVPSMTSARDMLESKNRLREAENTIGGNYFDEDDHYTTFTYGNKLPNGHRIYLFVKSSEDEVDKEFARKLQDLAMEYCSKDKGANISLRNASRSVHHSFTLNN